MPLLVANPEDKFSCVEAHIPDQSVAPRGIATGTQINVYPTTIKISSTYYACFYTVRHADTHSIASVDYCRCASTRENLSLKVCEQQRRILACASAQSDQRLCYSLIGKYHI